MLKQTLPMNFEQRVARKNAFDASLVFGTKAFNQATGRDRHMAKRKKDDALWIDPQTGELEPSKVKSRLCPICQQSEGPILFVKKGFPHKRCADCQLVYVSVILNEQAYEELYEREDSYAQVLQSAWQKQMQEVEADYLLDVLEMFAENPLQSICEIGCGMGLLLKRAKMRGYDAYAIEPNAQAGEALRKEQIEFYEGFFPKCLPELSRSFDCVFMLNVLEHLPDPAESLRKVQEIMNPGGLLFLSVPNVHALVNRVMHQRAGTFGGHTHIQHFSVQTLTQLVCQCDFEVLDVETMISELGTLRNHLNYEDPYLGNCEQDSLLDDLLTPERLYKNHLARSINLLGRKL